MSNITNAAGEEHIRRIAAIVLGVDELNQIDRLVEQYIAQIRVYRPEIPVIAIFPIGSSSDTQYWIRRIGISGYIPRSTSIEVAAAALRLVIAGGQYFPHTNQAGSMQRQIDFQAGSVQHAAGLPNTLTPREMAVLDRLSRGNANKIIAYELNISLSTVKAHVHSIIRKMKVRNRTEVAVMAREACLPVNQH
jgi:DNA-binding NarL/FixJ family response regulator